MHPSLSGAPRTIDFSSGSWEQGEPESQETQKSLKNSLKQLFQCLRNVTKI